MSAHQRLIVTMLVFMWFEWDVNAEEKSLAAYWDFDEGSGVIVHDRSGNKVNGAVDGTAWNKNGKYGGAIEFTGESKINFRNNPKLNMGVSSFSIEAWVQQDLPAEREKNTATTGLVFSKCAYTGKIYLGYAVFGMTTSFARRDTDESYGPAYNFVLTGEDGSGIGDYGCQRIGSSFPLEKWTHMAIVADRDKGRVFYYQDGDLVTTIDATSATGDIDNDFDFFVGYSHYGGVEYYTKAILDEMAIYKRALSGEEIKKRYAGNQPLSAVLELPAGKRILIKR